MNTAALLGARPLGNATADGSTLAWETFLIVGLLPPVALWVLWRIQRLSVEALRLAMVKLVRRAAPLYHVVSWFGTLLHELSHAILLAVSGLGIKDFSVRSEEGHVTPRRMPKTGIGSLFLIVAAMAPMYAVPAIVLAAALILLDPMLLAWGTPAFGVEAMDEMTDSLLGFPPALVRAMAGIDVADWRHAVFLALVLVGAPGTRPSFVKGDGLLGGGGDIGVVRGQVKRRPWLLAIAPVLIFVGYYAVLPLYPAMYWWPFQALYATALTGIVIALLGAAVWWTAAANTRIKWWLGWIPLMLLVAGQVVGRAAGYQLEFVNLASLSAWAAAAWVLSVVAPRRDKIDRAIRRR